MDIAKYIGLFLLKNHFCYIHGLGNLELRKRSATHDGETLRGPSYEVVITQGGSIDDNLANFIATNEFISISKASNALRDFSTNTKIALQEGKEVAIPNIGKFLEVNGKVSFTTDPNLQYTPHSIPTIRTERKIEPTPPPKPYAQPVAPAQTSDKPQNQPSYEYEPARNGSVDWRKVIIAAAGVIILIGLGLFTYNFLKGGNSRNEAAAPPQAVVPPVTVPAKPDSTAIAAAAAKNADTLRTYNFVIDDYDTKKKAEKRVALMISYGHKDVKMVVQDSSMYLVLQPIKCAPSDTTRIMDSLSKFYNYPGVSIYP